MKLGMEVCFGPGHTVLDGDPVTLPKKGAQQPPLFGPCLLWLNGWMDQDATRYEGRPRPRPHCVRLGIQLPPLKKGTAPNFWLMSIVVKRSPISATAEHLSNKLQSTVPATTVSHELPL